MREKHQQIFAQIKKSEKILIVFPALWNGDAIASALAFYLFLKKTGKEVDIVSAKDELSDILSITGSFFSFLPSFSLIKSNASDLASFTIILDTEKTQVKKIKYQVEDKSVRFLVNAKNGAFSPADVTVYSGLSGYDLIITLDTPDLESLGILFDKNTNFFYKTPIINIDHHSANEEYGQINLIDLNSVSTSEILFSLMNSENEALIDHNIATCLLTGIIIKTKNFKTANITPETLFSTSKLIIKEARREEIISRIFLLRSLRVLKLWGRILARLSGLKDNKIIWSTINEVDFTKTSTNVTDLSDIIEELIINIPEAEVIMIFYENPDKKDDQGRPQTDLLVHTPKNLNIKDIVKEYRPRGTDKFMKIETQKALKETKQEIIELLNKKIGQYSF